MKKFFELRKFMLYCIVLCLIYCIFCEIVPSLLSPKCQILIRVESNLPADAKCEENDQVGSPNLIDRASHFKPIT